MGKAKFPFIHLIMVRESVRVNIGRRVSNFDDRRWRYAIAMEFVTNWKTRTRADTNRLSCWVSNTKDIYGTYSCSTVLLLNHPKWERNPNDGRKIGGGGSLG